MEVQRSRSAYHDIRLMVARMQVRTAARSQLTLPTDCVFNAHSRLLIRCSAICSLRPSPNNG